MAKSLDARVAEAEVRPEEGIVEREKAVIVVGLVLGFALGMAGTFMPAGSMQTVLWAVSSVGIVAAGFLLAVRLTRSGHTVDAAGFAALAAAEIVLWAGGIPGSGGYDASFSAGLLFYVPALLLLAIGDATALLSRVACAVAALPFAIHAALHLLGRDPGDTWQGIGYGLLTLAAIGWTVGILRESRVEVAA